MSDTLEHLDRIAAHQADVPGQGLEDYPSLDDAVNHLYALGFKASARELNSKKGA